MKKALYLVVTLLVLVALAFLLGLKSVIAPQASVSPTVSASVTPTTSATPVAQASITVTSPKSGDTVGSPITVTGRARVFENQFSYILRDSSGKKIVEGNAMSNATDSSQFGDFTIKIPVPVGATKDLTVEVFEYSAKDGSVINLVRVPVTLASTKTMSVKVSMGKIISSQCDAVSQLSRTVITTNEPAYVALSELLHGPSVADTASGYTSAIPNDVRINSLIVRSGVAYADFNENLDAGVAGSCRVTAIRAQITQTLLQFSSIKSVTISRNGHTDGVLQP